MSHVNLYKKIDEGADYMEIFNAGWTFSLAYQVEISARLNNKLLFKMTLKLHVKNYRAEISIWCTELKKNTFIWKISKPQVKRKFNKSK